VRGGGEGREREREREGMRREKKTGDDGWRMDGEWMSRG
jgi:hypothetical protein